MLTTSSADYDAQFRLLRQHGMSVSDRVRHGAHEVIFEEHTEIGFNYRMTDIQAAVGREQLRRLPEIITARRRIAAAYSSRLSEVAGVRGPIEPDGMRSNWQSYTVELPTGCDQRNVMQQLLLRGVASRRGVMCAHREIPYRTMQRHSLAESERAQDRFIILPLYPQMTDDDVDYVVSTLVAAISD